MKKLVLAVFLTLAMIFTLTACGGSTSTDTTDEASTVPEIPVSDVTDGTGLEGTWDGTLVQNDITTEMVLALNSDGTFEYWFSSNDSNADNVAMLVDGTYTTEGDKINLEAEVPEDEDIETSITEEPLFGDEGATYVVSGNDLTITAPNGQEYKFTRSTGTDSETTDSTDTATTDAKTE